MVKIPLKYIYIKKNICFLFILCTAIFLRFYKLGAKSFWYDEAISLIHTIRFKDILYATSILFNQGAFSLYSIFLHYWKFIGTDGFILRLAPAVTSIFVVIIVYLFTKLLFDERPAIYAALITAISPLQIHYSQELTMYSLVSLLSLTCVALFVLGIKRNNNWIWFLFVLFTIIDFYTHMLTFLIILAENIYFFLFIKKHKIFLKKWLIIQFLVLIFSSPWIFASVVFLINNFNTKHIWWLLLPHPTVKNIFFTLKNFNVGYHAPTEVYWATFILFLLPVIIALMMAERKVKDKRRFIWLCFTCFLFPVLFLFIISKFFLIYVDRYIIFASLFYYILIGLGISWFNKMTQFLIVLSMLFFTYFSLVNYYRDVLPGNFEEHVGVQTKKAERGAAEYIRMNFDKDDLILHTSESSILPFQWYFSPELYRKSNIFFATQNKDLFYKRLILKIKNGKPEILLFSIPSKATDLTNKINIYNRKRIWLVFSDWIWSEAVKNESGQMKTKKWMDENFHKIAENSFREVTVYLYSPPVDN